MTVVQFHPDDIDAVRQGVYALERERQWVAADRLADLADRMATERQHEMMAEVVRRLDRPLTRDQINERVQRPTIIEGGGG